MTEFSFSDLQFVAWQGRPGLEAFARETGLDPLDCASVLIRGLAGFPPEFALDSRRQLDEEIMARAYVRDRENRDAALALHKLRTDRGDYGRCPCGRQGTLKYPLAPRVDGEGPPLCYFCGAVKA